MSLAFLLSHSRTLLLLACALTLGGCGFLGIDSGYDPCDEYPESCDVAPETPPETESR